MDEHRIGYGLPTGEPSQSPGEPLTLRPQGKVIEFAEHHCDLMPKRPRAVMIHVVDDACDLWVFNSGDHFVGFIKYCPWCGEQLTSKEAKQKNVGKVGEATLSALAGVKVSS